MFCLKNHFSTKIGVEPLNVCSIYSSSRTCAWTTLCYIIYLTCLKYFFNKRFFYQNTVTAETISPPFDGKHHAHKRSIPRIFAPNSSAMSPQSKPDRFRISTRIKSNLDENQIKSRRETKRISARIAGGCSWIEAQSKPHRRWSAVHLRLKKRFLRSVCDVRKVLRTSRQFRSLHSLQFLVASLAATPLIHHSLLACGPVDAGSCFCKAQDYASVF